MQTKTTIRSCTKDDFSGVLKLLQQLWPKRTFVTKDVKRTFNDAIQSANQFYFCAKQKNEVVGFGSLSIKNGLYAMGKVAILDELIVDDNHRKQGIAKIVVDHMVNFAKKKKCLCMELECGAHRKPAHSFYEKYGFEKGEGYFFSIDLI